jgi:hypothetical protein
MRKVNRTQFLLAALMSIAITTPPVYARGGYSPPEVSISIFLILFFLAGFWLIALFIENMNLKEKEKPRNPDAILTVISAIASIMITFLAAYFFEFKLVGGGAVLGAVILFAAYGFIYKSLS